MSSASQLWTDRLARFATAGQTIDQFCAAEGVSAASFYAWKRKLAAPPVAATPLVPIQITPAISNTATLELLMPSGTRLRLPVDYEPQRLATLLIALEAHSC